MRRMKMSDNKLSSVVLTGEEGGKNMRYMRRWHITLKTLTCTLHWFCEKSYEERHIEHLDTLGGRRWVHAVLSTQGFAKEDASEHAQGHWCPWRSNCSCLFWIEHDWTHLWFCQCISKHWPLNKTYQTSPDTLETRPPKTRNPQTWLLLITLKSVESLGKRLSTCRWVLRPPPGPSRGGVIHCE